MATFTKKSWLTLLIILIGGLLFAAGFLYSIWYFESRIYLKSSFWNGEEYEKANITGYIEEGATYVIDEIDGTRLNSIRLKYPPSVTNKNTISKINKAMRRVGNMVLPDTSREALQKFNSAGNLSYLETYAFDSKRLVHVYVTDFTSASGQTIYLYPHIAAGDGNLTPKIGELTVIWECFKRYKQCPEYATMGEYNFDFLLNPDTY